MYVAKCEVETYCKEGITYYEETKSFATMELMCSVGYTHTQYKYDYFSDTDL